MQPTPGTLQVSPSSVTICPSSGASSCPTDSASVALSQTYFSGSIGESDTCGSSIASVTAAQGGVGWSFQITGGSVAGTCRATFTGGGGQQAGVAIIVSPPGVGIDLVRHFVYEQLEGKKK